MMHIKISHTGDLQSIKPTSEFKMQRRKNKAATSSTEI